MLSKSDSKLIRSLKLKKFREQEGLFVVEGVKMVREALDSGFSVSAVYVRDEGWLPAEVEAISVSEREMSEMTHLTTPSSALALVEIPETNVLHIIKKIDQNQLYLGLDAIRDPGNLGTIIRTADWFGVRTIFASPDTVDLYNPKVVQASMGALFRVQVVYIDLIDLLANIDLPVWGTSLQGTSIYESDLSNNGVILIGNEAHGLSLALQQKIDHALFIPPYSSGASTSESLNASVATAIICAEFRRRTSIQKTK